ncbi:MAG: T9SS type A sorting domain-containing protein, partial [Bacteroidota bacterium]
FMDNMNYAAIGQADEMITSPINLSFVTNPFITFQVAYQLYTNPALSPNYSDTLKVEISTDCGLTWTNIYTKYSTQLTTATPVFSTTPFVPTASQWRLETIALTPYSSSNVLIKFRHITGFENQMYVDDINITGVLGVNEYDLNEYVSIYPNPSNGKIQVISNQYSVIGLEVYNVMGEKVFQSQYSIPNTQYLIDLSSQPSGVYFINIRTDKGNIVKKLIINK